MFPFNSFDYNVKCILLQKLYTIFVLTLLFFPSTSMAECKWLEVVKNVHYDFYNSRETDIGLSYYELHNMETEYNGRTIKSTINHINLNCSNFTNTINYKILYSSPNGTGEKLDTWIFDDELKQKVSTNVYQFVITPKQGLYGILIDNCDVLTERDISSVQNTWLILYDISTSSESEMN